MIHPQHWMPRAGGFFALLSFGATAYSATWSGGRTTPALREVVAIDATGEPNWPYGAEDVAGDGLGSFQPAEQSIDVRTAYAAADPQNFWARIYVSSAAPPGANLHGFVFIDSDRNAATGGTAVAPEINAKLTNDPSPGGYEHVLEVGGNGAALQLWTWQGAQYAATVTRPAPRIAGEGGADTDPIRLLAVTHGYIQASIDLAAVDLTGPCNANLFVRTVNDTPALGAGDLDVGRVDSCVAADADRNGVPDVIVPPGGCTSDAQCPAGGICQAGKCVLAPACVTTADCGAGMQCTADGRCVPVPSGTCTTNADCNGLVCQGRQCAACAPGANQCAAGQVCAPDGHCIVNQGPGGGVNGAGGGPLVLAADESVKGGACHCTLSVRSGATGAPALCVAAIALLVSRRRSSRCR
jgi:Cys-rich repeat protein